MAVNILSFDQKSLQLLAHLIEVQHRQFGKELCKRLGHLANAAFQAKKESIRDQMDLLSKITLENLIITKCSFKRSQLIFWIG